MSKVEIVIFECHRRVREQVVDAGMSSATVLEDDKKLSSSLPNFIVNLESHISSVDVIKQDWIRRFRGFSPPIADFDVEIRLIA